MLFSSIPRVRLFDGPTPLHPLPRLGEAWGHPQLYIKRDDLIPLGAGGNKLRSAEFWLGEALAQGCDAILVAGGLASNQCRALAAASSRLGLVCHVLHNDEKPSSRQGNQLLNHLLGVEQIFLGKISEAERTLALEEHAERLRTAGRHPYIVGRPAVGAMGYVQAALELHAQAEERNLDIRHLFIAGSMGPTEAGLLWGAALLGRAFSLHTPSVEYDTETLMQKIAAICDDLSARFGFAPAVSPLSLLDAGDNFLGPGYDLMTPEALSAVRELASLEGIFIETTYNAKVFAALKAMIACGVLPRQEAICIFHTGGFPALFAQAERFA